MDSSIRKYPTLTFIQTSLTGRIFAGFHTDLNFLTIHGQSRYPGCRSPATARDSPHLLCAS
jgi:hypothetical protein